MSPRTSTPEDRRKMMDFVVNAEARRDKMGRLRVYKLPAADGGGTYEVAGINDRFHPAAAAKLRDLLAANRQGHAENFIRDYLLDYTAVVAKWTQHPAIEAFLRDTAFNRGPKGALRILQIALKVADDGKWGPMTKSALTAALKSPGALLQNLRTARESYEIRIAPPVGARAKFWRGLVNRWDKALSFAETLL
jgi:lysozyme family protein